MTIKVSVIIPVYNADLYLKECLDSVTGQTLKDFEIICVNDGSKDTSAEILKEYSEKDDRIKIITTKEHFGQSHARNLAIEKAKGEYIGFVDADDFAEKDMFEKLYSEAKSNKADMAMCRTKVFDDSVKNYKDDDYFALTCFDKYLNKKVFDHTDTVKFMTKINVSVWNKLYKRNFLKKTGVKFIEGFIYEDLPYFYETYTEAEKVVFVDDYLYNYRIKSQNSTMTRTDKNVKDRIEMMSHTYEILKKQPYFSKNKANILDWVIHDIFYRCLLIDSKYQKEYFFRMQKFFKTLDISDVETSLLKNPYYPHFCEIIKCNYDELIKYFINKESIGEAYLIKSKTIYEKDFSVLKEKEKEIFQKEEQLNKRQKELDSLQEKILKEEKEHWTDYEQKLAELQTEKEEQEKNLEILQEKILKEEKEHWNNYEQKLAETEQRKKEFLQEYEQKIAAFEREKLEHNLSFTKDNAEIEKKKTELYNLEQKILKDEKEKWEQFDKKVAEIEKNTNKHLVNQLKLQEDNYKKILEFRNKVIEGSQATPDKCNRHADTTKQNITTEVIMHRPKISIILPVYNVAPYLRQSLDSIINQTLSDLEIICVDDGSTDESSKILDEYKEKDSRIIVIHKENAGTGAARNDGLKLATGECIGFVDPDDWILPNMYERLYNLLKEKDLDIVMFTPDVYNDKTKKHEGFLYFQDSNFPSFLDNKIFNKDDISPFSYPMCVWNKLYTKKLFDENNIDFAEGLDFEDHKVIFKTLFTAKRIYFIREKLYVYRHSREGSILSDNDTRMFDHIKIYDVVENILKETGNWEKFHLDFLRYKVHNILYYYSMIKPQYKEEYYNKMVKSLRSTEMSEEEINILNKDYPDLKPIMEVIFINKIKKAVKKITKRNK